MRGARVPTENVKDACCRCGAIQDTPADPDNPGDGELHVWHPDVTQVAQWICSKCADVLEGIEGAEDPLA